MKTFKLKESAEIGETFGLGSVEIKQIESIYKKEEGLDVLIDDINNLGLTPMQFSGAMLVIGLDLNHNLTDKIDE